MGRKEGSGRWEVRNEETGLQGHWAEGSGNGGMGTVQPSPRLASGGSRRAPLPHPASGPEHPGRAPCPSCRGQHPAGTEPSHHPALTARIRCRLGAAQDGWPGDLRAQGPQVSEGLPVTSSPARPPRLLQPASRQWPDAAPDRSLRPLSAAPAGLRPRGPE